MLHDDLALCPLLEEGLEGADELDNVDVRRTAPRCDRNYQACLGVGLFREWQGQRHRTSKGGESTPGQHCFLPKLFHDMEHLYLVFGTVACDDRRVNCRLLSSLRG